MRRTHWPQKQRKLKKYVAHSKIITFFILQATPHRDYPVAEVGWPGHSPAIRCNLEYHCMQLDDDAMGKPLAVRMTAKGS